MKWPGWNVSSRLNLHPSDFILHPFVLARLRTYPQHTPPLLPLLRSRPGGVHKANVVRSPKSDNLLSNLCPPILSQVRNHSALLNGK